MALKGNIIKLSELDGPDAQKKQILEDLGDLAQYEVLDEECIIAIYAESNVLSRIKDNTGKTIELVGTQNRATESRYQGKAGLLVKIGPQAFRFHNNGQNYEGVIPRFGDWVVSYPQDGREIALRRADAPSGLEWVTCRRIHWRSIFMRVKDPRVIY
jgi:hypothetical protein